MYVRVVWIGKQKLLVGFKVMGSMGVSAKRIHCGTHTHTKFFV